MLAIERLNASNTEQVKHVHLPDEQIPFSGSAEEFVLSGTDATHLHVIKYHGDVIGFFKLDLNYALHYPFCPSNGLGLRAFALDINHQNQGLGSQLISVLLSYLAKYYSNYQWLYLTVNCKNIGAKRCYEKGGLEDTSELYLGGSAGPQHIMRGEI